jgi:hypothetical protein
MGNFRRAGDGSECPCSAGPNRRCQVLGLERERERGAEPFPNTEESHRFGVDGPSRRTTNHVKGTIYPVSRMVIHPEE